MDLESLITVYHHDFSCVSADLLKLVAASNPTEYERRKARVERFEAVKQQAERWYR